jgi:hypothetical protein
MTEKDKEYIKGLQSMGYKIFIRDLDAPFFSRRYRVYQEFGFENLKRVIVDDDGTVIGLQG